MKTFDKITGYVYAADSFCDKCLKRYMFANKQIDEELKAQRIEDILDIVSKEWGVDRTNEWSYNSDDFPKVIFASDAEFMEDMCSRCDKCL
jgi:hypothetical protein